MKTQTLIIIVSSIIIGFILIGILVGFLIKSNNGGDNNGGDNNGGDIFKEIPFKYKLPVAKMGNCPLINSRPSDSSPQCPISLNYDETVQQCGGIWSVDPLTDKSQSMCF